MTNAEKINRSQTETELKTSKIKKFTHWKLKDAIRVKTSKLICLLVTWNSSVSKYNERENSGDSNEKDLSEILVQPLYNDGGHIYLYNKFIKNNRHDIMKWVLLTFLWRNVKP